MASVTRTKIFTIGQTITREDIADLIEESLLSDIGLSDLDPTALVVTAQSEAPASPVPGAWWWDKTTQLMKVYDSTHSLWLALGPDRRDIPVLNWNGGALPKGAYMCNRRGIGPWDGTVKLGTRATATAEMVIGTIPATALSGAWTPLSYCGIVWCYVSAGQTIAPSNYVYARDNNTGEFRNLGEGDPTGEAPIISLGSTTGGQSIQGMWIGWKRG